MVSALVHVSCVLGLNVFSDFSLWWTLNYKVNHFLPCLAFLYGVFIKAIENKLGQILVPGLWRITMIELPMFGRRWWESLKLQSRKVVECSEFHELLRTWEDYAGSGELMQAWLVIFQREVWKSLKDYQSYFMILWIKDLWFPVSWSWRIRCVL